VKENREEEYKKKISGMKYSRIMAVGCLAIIGISIIATLITGITGSKYFYGCLFMCIVFPVFIYAILFIGRILFNISSEDTKEKSGANGKNKKNEND